jgi:hypothetical protein
MTKYIDKDGRVNEVFDAPSTPDEFWELVGKTGYIMEGEDRATEREWLNWLHETIEPWFAAHPDIHDDPAMSAVRRLIGAFVFNDRMKADDPEAMARYRREVFERAVAGGLRLDDPDL